MASRKTDIRISCSITLMHAKVRDGAVGLLTGMSSVSRLYHKFPHGQSIVSCSHCLLHLRKKVRERGHGEGLHSFPRSTIVRDCPIHGSTTSRPRTLSIKNRDHNYFHWTPRIGLDPTYFNHTDQYSKCKVRRWEPRDRLALGIA